MQQSSIIPWGKFEAFTSEYHMTIDPFVNFVPGIRIGSGLSARRKLRDL